MAEYCLRWNNHQPNLVTVFSELLNAESLVDVTLATDGHFIHAHKLVLSACSVYFKDLFGSNPCKHPIVFLKDIRIEDLKTVIDFIYRGEVNVSQERLQDVLKTAESLRIKGLADKPFSYDEYPSQSRGKHLSSSLSSQRSSLTDSREQPPSVDTEDCLDPANNNNNNNNTNSPPASKKRKVAASQDSSESFHQDTNHEGEEQINDVSPRKCSIPAAVTDEARTPPIDKIKVEEPEVAGGTADTRPEYQESRAADAMLLLQGSSSEGGEEGGGVALPPTTVSRGDSSSSSLVSSHSQGSRGRPPNTFFWRPKDKGVSPSPWVGGGSSSGGSECCRIILRPRLRASDGSSVTIRTGTADGFLQAVDAVRTGRMGFCKAGRLYGVNHATLQKFYKASGFHVRNRSNNPKFPRKFDCSEQAQEQERSQGCLRSSLLSHNPALTMYERFGPPFAQRKQASLFGPYEPQRSDLALMESQTASRGRSSNPALSNILSQKLESLASGRLLNYSSLFSDGLGLPEGDLKDAGSTSSISAASAPGDSRQQVGPKSLDAPIVLCNL